MHQLTAGIIIIGDEILSGRTKDTNGNFIAKELIKIGVKLSEIRIINDESEIIIKTVRNFHKKVHLRIIHPQFFSFLTH